MNAIAKLVLALACTLTVARAGNPMAPATAAPAPPPTVTVTEKEPWDVLVEIAEVRTPVLATPPAAPSPVAPPPGEAAPPKAGPDDADGKLIHLAPIHVTLEVDFKAHADEPAATPVGTPQAPPAATPGAPHPAPTPDEPPVVVSGPLGAKTNPVKCAMPAGERAYLQRLRGADGKAPSFHRVGSVGPGPYGNIMDLYEVKAGGKTVSIYMDMYHAGYVETQAVPGFTIVAK